MSSGVIITGNRIEEERRILNLTKITTVFTTVACPICGNPIDRKPDKQALAEHIRREHVNADIRACVVRLFEKLQLGLPNNFDKISEEELLVLLEDMSQYEATTAGLKQLRRKFSAKGGSHNTSK